MKQVRNGVFETNSSSVHAISIDSSGREPSQFQLNEHGKIEISFGSFGRESRTYYSQYDKLPYLMTCLYYIAGDDKEVIYDMYEFERIEGIICNYAKATGIEILDDVEPYIDHQSIPYGNIEIINSWDKDEVIDFVFNKYIRLKTYSD